MRIAILQRDTAQRGNIELVLAQGGHTCMPFSDEVVLTKALAASTVDMLVLDWHGTRLSGVDVLRNVRALNGDHIPVLFASEDTSDDSVVHAFAVGADDYVSLPICPTVFRARVDALFRRAFPDRCDKVTLDVGPYHFNMRRQSVTLNGKPVVLSGTQYRLAALFFANIGRVLSRDHIYAMVWGRELHTLTRTIDSHVSRLRVLLELDDCNGFRLQPVYKSGYRLLSLHDGVETFDRKAA
ncbi:response regulator transcription factor [Paraburkholderia dinghuensis]|uniref:DNA-binding response regulator n=1 Tax=Paraburkholderia dinghuensis TaxID=2305225 RepID=A0A3N6MNY3_9BURK|nr:response regulator transcription factor [Paraburkholderia dinghuensis]RQH05419.1 DNA-binding response regulator [Paraburkholderia dinghuensis]